MKRRLAASLFALAFAPSFMSSNAHALTNTQSLTSGTHYIGMVNGEAAIVTQRASDGVCEPLVIVPNSVNGLHDAAQLWGGAYGASSVFVVASTTSFCGYSISPLIRNGYQVQVGSGTANDRLYDLGLGGITLFGGMGDDTVATFSGSTVLVGYTGNDFLYGPYGTYAQGGDGADTLCPAPDQKLYVAEGGSGYDWLCGNGADYQSGIEATACTCSLF